MLYTFATRQQLVEILGPLGEAVEVGVYQGEFSKVLLKQATRLNLIDIWDQIDVENFLPPYRRDDPAAMSALQARLHGYFPEGIEKSLTLAEQQVRASFGQDERVRIFKGRSDALAREFADGSLDFLYVDGNHRYEFALGDLLLWSPKLKPTGTIMLNDYYRGPGADTQYCEVIEAVNHFLHRSDFRPVAMTHGVWGDIMLTRQAHLPDVYNRVLAGLIVKNINVVDLPNLVLPSYHHIGFHHGGSPYFLPSFQI